MKNAVKSFEKGLLKIPAIVGVCLVVLFSPGYKSAPRPIPVRGRMGTGQVGVAPDAAAPDIPDEIRKDVAERLFGGDSECEAFRAGVRRVSFDRRALKDATRDPVQASLYRHLTESIYILAVDPRHNHHALVYKNGKLLFERAVPAEHYAVLERLFRPLERVSPPEGAETNEITVEEFLDGLTGIVSPECKEGIERTLLRAGRNAHELIRAVQMLQTEEEKQGAYWLLGRMEKHAYVCIRRDGNKKTYYMYYDAQQLRAEDFYEIVHYAYKARHTFPWSRNLPEDRFRRFVLEYRHTEAPLAPGLRAHMFRALEPYVKNLANIEDVVHQVNLICSCLVIYRKDMRWEDQDLRMMFATSQARCEGKSNFASAMLRSVGVPNGYVSTPAWPKIDGNHAWNVAFDGEKVLSFMGCEYRKGKPDFDRYQDSEVAKVYLREPNGDIQDLTASYTPTTDYSLEAGAEFAGQALYLNVWNSNEWRPVAKAAADEKGTATFKDVGCRSDFLFCVTAGIPKEGTESLRTVVITKEGKALEMVTGEDDPSRAALTCRMDGLDADTQYLLRTWTGKEWRKVAAVASDAGGTAEIEGRKGRLYRLDGADGKPATRPFQLKAAGDGTELTKY